MAAPTNHRRRHRRPGHALPSAEPKVLRRGLARSRHAARDRAQSIAEGTQTRFQQRTMRVLRTRAGTVARRVHAAGVIAYLTPDVSTRFLPSNPPLRSWSAPATSTRVLGAGLIGCAAVVVALGVADLSHPTSAPAPSNRHENARAALPFASAPLPSSQSSGSDAPGSFLTPPGSTQIDAGAPLGDMRWETPEVAAPDLAQLVEGLSPPPHNDPDLVGALTELDKNAERDESIRQRQLAGQLPPDPALGIPGAPADPLSAPPIGTPVEAIPTGAPAPEAPAPAQLPTASPIPQPAPPANGVFENSPAGNVPQPLGPPPGPVN